MNSSEGSQPLDRDNLGQGGGEGASSDRHANCKRAFDLDVHCSHN